MDNIEEVLKALRHMAMASYSYRATEDADPTGLAGKLTGLPWLENDPLNPNVWVITQALDVDGRIRITPNIVTVTGFESPIQGVEGDTVTLLQLLITTYGYSRFP